MAVFWALKIKYQDTYTLADTFDTPIFRQSVINVDIWRKKTIRDKMLRTVRWTSS